MTDAPTRSPPASFRGTESAKDHALEIRSVTRSDKDRFEAAMTIAFSADPAARWVATYGPDRCVVGFAEQCPPHLRPST